jgi:hypothetical protein
MQSLPRLLARTGALIAGPSFVLNAAYHGGSMPGPGEIDRADGAFSIMFMVGAALVFAAIVLARPLPLGRKTRWLLAIEAILIAMAFTWAVVGTIDPKAVEDPNVFVAICDGGWPLHQVFMLVIGISGAVSKKWPSPDRFFLFGPVIGILLLGAGAGAGIDYLAASGIGAGWVIAAIGVLRVTCSSNPQESSAAVRPEPAY